jgi:hypothetical protein
VATHIQEDQSKATFIFEGTIRKLRAATMPDVPVSTKTTIVRIDRVITGTSDLSAFLGQDITVEVSGGQRRVGQKLVFHAEPWMFGAGVAVRSKYEEPASRARAQPNQPDAYRDADLVVRGKVVRVQLPKTRISTRVKSSTSPITEHAPLWREAIIQVNEVLKGNEKRNQVRVRFPASSDVMFHGVARFEPGQEGYFMLHKADAMKMSRGAGKRPSAARGRRDEPSQTYVAFEPQDFRPLDK